MRPTPIPDEEVNANEERIVIVGPDGDPTSDVRPVEALIGVTDNGYPTISLRWIAEDDDAERLANGEPLYITLMTDQLPPISVGLLRYDEDG